MDSAKTKETIPTSLAFDARHILRPHAQPFQPAKPGPAEPIDPASVSLPPKSLTLQRSVEPDALIDPALAASPSTMAPVQQEAQHLICCSNVEPWAGPPTAQPALNSCFEWIRQGREVQVTTMADPPCYIELWEFSRDSNQETYQTRWIRYLYPDSADENDPSTAWNELVHPTGSTTKLFLVSFKPVKDVEGWVNCVGEHQDVSSFKLK